MYDGEYEKSESRKKFISKIEKYYTNNFNKIVSMSDRDNEGNSITTLWNFIIWSCVSNKVKWIEMLDDKFFKDLSLSRNSHSLLNRIKEYANR